MEEIKKIDWAGIFYDLTETYGYNKKDLMKVIHYAILALNNHNLQHEKV